MNRLAKTNTRSSSALVASGFLLSALLCAAACGGGNENLPPPPPPPPPPPMPSAIPTTTAPAEDAGPPAPAAPPVALQEGSASPDPAAPLPTVKLIAPAKGQVVAAKDAADFAIKLDVKNWKTATGSSHVHLIIDNRPYKAIYDPTKPVKLSELFGGDAIDEGQHVLVAFPSRANHESVKTKGALVVSDFWVGKKTTPAPIDLTKPLLVYSRPKGDYKGDMANHVLIDFQLVNDTLAEGKDHVAIAVTGPGIDDKLTAKATKFGAPFYLDNLQNGSYTVKLDLLDGSNAPVAGPWNSTTRKINVDHEAQPEPMPGMAGMGGDAGAPAATSGSDGGASAAPAVSKPAPASNAAPKPKK
jgi:hypothetical protein